MASASSFKKAKTIAEVYAIAKELKKAGEDPVEVNRLVSEKKADLLKKSERVKYLTKLRPSPYPLQSSKVSTLNVRAENMTSGAISINKDGSIVI